MLKGYAVHPGKAYADYMGLFAGTLGEGTFQALEIAYPHQDPFVSETQASEYLRALRDAAQEFGPRISLHPPLDLDLAYPNRAIRASMIDEYKRVMDFAMSMNATLIALHPGTICPQGFSGHPQFPLRAFIEKRKKQIFHDTISGIRVLLEHTKGSSLIMAVENLIHTYDITWNPKELDALVAAVSHERLKALVDLGHAYLLGMEPADFIEELKSDIAHIHIHDNNGSLDQHMYPGTGQIDFPRTFRALRERKYQGSLVFEVKTDDIEELNKAAGCVHSWIGQEVGPDSDPVG